MEEKEKLNLGTLNDEQKSYLTQISYLDISEEGQKKIAEGGITVNELVNYIDNPDTPFTGTAVFSDEDFDKMSSDMISKDEENKRHLLTNRELAEMLIAKGLGNIKITDSISTQGFSSSGFQALAFEDEVGNTGISYRGSDFDLAKGGARDWIEADMYEYFSGDSQQIKEAQEFFEKNKNKDGKNYVYGHSLGGNLTSHVYLEHYDEISEAFTINGNPINEKLLDTDEKVAAFNDSEKFHCYIVCGDMVGHLKSFDKYKDNVKYIKNNGEYNTDFVSAHLVQSSTYDENGKFVETTEEEMIQTMTPFTRNVTKLTKRIRKELNDLEDKVNEAFKPSYGNYKLSVNNHFDHKLTTFRMDPSESQDLTPRQEDINELKQMRTDILGYQYMVSSNGIQEDNIDEDAGFSM